MISIIAAHHLTRRGFLTRASSAATVLCSGVAAPNQGPSQNQKWDMRWVEKLNGAHRVVFDSPEMADGTVLVQFWSVLQGYRDVYGADTSLQAVIVMRASGVRMAFNSSIWNKFKLNQELKVSGAGNPFINQISRLNDMGVTLLACNMATSFYSQQMASRAGLSVASVFDEVRSNLAPGVVLMPSGVFAVIRAQEAGCQMLVSA